MPIEAPWFGRYGSVGGVVAVGGAPAAPASVTTAVPGSTLITFGGTGASYLDIPNFTAGKTSFGFNGHAPYINYLDGYGNSNRFKGSTASGDAVGGVYDLQRAFEGLTATANGNVTGRGLFEAQQAGAISKTYLTVYMTQNTHPTAGLFGDISLSATRADVATKVGNIASFLSFVGGTGISMDLETGQWSPPAGVSLATYNALLEQLGLEVGTAIFAAFPACELLLYNLQPEGSWHEYVNRPDPGGLTNADIARVRFTVGLMNAHTNANATGRIRWLDHFWYRAATQVSGVSLVTALKWNTQGALASLSSYLPAATWTHVAQLFDVVPFSWAGTDSTAFYTNSQESQPTWTNNQETYRQWTMGGLRAEFTLYSPDGLWLRNATLGLYAGNNDYSFPSGRAAGMLSAQSTSGSFSTTAPNVTCGSTGSGGTRILTGTATHAFGIRCVKAYVYPSGTPVMAPMARNLNGGTPTTGIPNSYMDWTTPITGVTPGSYAIVTAYSTLGQEKSMVVTL